MTSFPINIEEGVSDDFIPDGFVRPSFLPLLVSMIYMQAKSLS